MGGFVYYEDGVMVRIAEREDLELWNRDHWQNSSEKDIHDKSKGDSFSKGFAVLQTTWFVSKCIARGVAGLVVTELELATLAFAVLNGILYFLWRNKPLEVFCPVPIYLPHPTSYRSITFALPSDEQCSYVDDRLSLATRERSLERHSSTSFQHSSAFRRFRAYCHELLRGLLFAPTYFFFHDTIRRQAVSYPFRASRPPPKPRGPLFVRLNILRTIHIQ